MANAREQRGSGGNMAAGTGMVFFAAAVLIVVGGVFQLGELGFGRGAAQALWLLSVLAPDLWNAVDARLSAPEWQELMHYWPLGLIGTGVSLMLISYYGIRPGGDARPMERESHGA